MVIKVHLNVAGGDVDLVAALGLDTVVMSLLLVVLTTGKSVGAVVHRRDATESVLEGFVHLLVPFGVANHLFLFSENLSARK